MLWKFLRSSLVMYNLEMWLRYSHSFPIYWPYWLPEQPCLKHKYRGQCSKSRCDFTDDVIKVTVIYLYLICHLVFISKVKSNLSCTEHGLWQFSKTVDFRSDILSNRNQSRNSSVSGRYPVSLTEKRQFEKNTFHLTRWRHRSRNWHSTCPTRIPNSIPT